jgi:hypothetical protein
MDDIGVIAIGAGPAEKTVAGRRADDGVVGGVGGTAVGGGRAPLLPVSRAGCWARIAGDRAVEVVTADVGELPSAALWQAVPPFRTVSEVWPRPLEAYGL